MAGGESARQVSPSMQNGRVALKNNVCTLRLFLYILLREGGKRMGKIESDGSDDNVH